ncbi:MAG: histidine ammonia-lyase, partial [Mesorhizobium sp.]
MTARVIVLDAKPLSTEDVAEIARRNARLVLGEEAMRRIRASRALIEHLTQLGKPLYGVTTGLGACVDTPLAQADLIAFQHSVPLSHSMGAGPSLPTEAVRALMVARICGMAAGGTGTSEGVVLGLL